MNFTVEGGLKFGTYSVQTLHSGRHFSHVQPVLKFVVSILRNIRFFLPGRCWWFFIQVIIQVLFEQNLPCPPHVFVFSLLFLVILMHTPVSHHLLLHPFSVAALCPPVCLHSDFGSLQSSSQIVFSLPSTLSSLVVTKPLNEAVS